MNLFPNSKCKLGSCVNGSPHSVCVHLPRLADVRAYEEGDVNLLNCLETGYPRFFTNPFLSQLEAYLCDRYHIKHRKIYLLNGSRALEELRAYLREDHEGLDACCVDRIFAVAVSRANKVLCDKVRLFLQHTGFSMSSREAEDHLLRYGQIKQVYSEPLAFSNTDYRIRERLHHIYETQSPEDIYLFSGGMNAFYHGFQAIKRIQEQRHRSIWVRLGWLYLDTVQIMEKFGSAQRPPEVIYDVCDFDALKRLIDDEGQNIAGIVTEVPTNPLVQTCDLERLHALARHHDIALILDPTIASPHNVHILEYCDVHINSLTKYAASEGDVMMGALALNAASPFYSDLKKDLDQVHVMPYSRDLARLAYEIESYENVIEKINKNTLEVVSFLEKHPLVRDVYWASQESTRDAYELIAKGAKNPGGIISFTLNADMETFYDAIPIVKSPSFGTRFSMICPFLYLAHYDLVSSDKGRERLFSLGIDPDLIRFSVGTECVKDIISALSMGLDACLKSHSGFK